MRSQAEWELVVRERLPASASGALPLLTRDALEGAWQARRPADFHAATSLPLPAKVSFGARAERGVQAEKNQRRHQSAL